MQVHRRVARCFQHRAEVLRNLLTQPSGIDDHVCHAPALQASQAMHALGRVGQPEDVAACMAWLLGAEASWVTGQVYGVDGGLGTVRSK